MATTVDRVITQYDLIDNYSAKLDKISRATSHFGSNVLKAGVASLAAFAAAIGVAAVASSKFAIDSAIEFDTMTRKLQAFTGSAEEAARLMQFVQKLAGPSLFETTDLAKGATLLAAYGLNVEKVLPLVDKLASAMGESGESVSEVARVFGRLKSGDFGEAFERLRDFGISFDDLREKGLRFSKSNEYLGTKLEALAAVSAIIEEKFGRISEVMRDSPEAKFASAMDAIRKSAIEVGNVFLVSLVPQVERFTRLLKFLSSKDVFANIAKGFTDVGNTIGKAFGLETTSGIFTIIAALEELPRLFGDIMKVGSAFFNMIAQHFPILKLLGIIGTTAVGAADKFLGTNFADTGGRISARAAALSKGFQQSEQRSSVAETFLKPLIDSFSMGGNDSKLAGINDNPVMQTLQKIESSTGATADNTRQALDLRRFALGGGELGAMGVSVVDRYGNRNAQGSRGVSVNVTGRDALARAMQEIAQQVLAEARMKNILR